MTVSRTKVLLASLVVAAILPTTAKAVGGNYVIAGGTPSERQQVVDALNASSFDWSIVPGPVTITISANPVVETVPGQIWVNAGLLDSGEFSWGTVQHEYGHQVDFALLDDAQRAQLLAALGGVTWWNTDPTLQHSQYGCERFASTLAWAYWQSPDNAMAPKDIGGESGGMQPASFRALLASMLGSEVAAVPSPSTPPAVRLSAPKTGQGAKVSLGLAGSGLSLEEKPVRATPSGLEMPVTVVDARGSGAGWQLRLVGARMRQVVSVVARCAPKSTCTLPHAVPSSDPRLVFEAAPASGMGRIDLKITLERTGAAPVGVDLLRPANT